MKLTVADFAMRCGGVVSHVNPGAVIERFALDNREAEVGSLFIAIKGERVDGHDFAADAISKGSVATLVERDLGLPQILVPDIAQALANFGSSVRSEFAGPVVGITGSNGKTSTKEFCAGALAPLGKVLKSPGNRNTEYTSPLLWAELESGHAAAVVEMAMRGFNQIRHLTKIARPTCAVVTMVGTAHIEKVGSREGIARAKAEIFDGLTHNGNAIIWREDDYFDDLRNAAGSNVRTFGFSNDAECQIVGYRAIDIDQSAVLIALDGQTTEIKLRTLGRHQALNAAAAMLAAYACGVKCDQAALGIASAELPPMRMQKVEHGGATILLDNYNASPDSTIAAIQTLIELPCSGRKLAVIGEMRELGNFAEAGHRAVGEALATATLDNVLLFGESTSWTLASALAKGQQERTMRRADELQEIREFLAQLAPGDLVLVKGSRALELEKALPLEVEH